MTSPDLVAGDRARDTIVALATPPGRGAIAVVRLSGPGAFDIAARHVRSWPPEPRRPHLSDIVSADAKLDQALVTLFPSPNSFTGEDTVEISTHGGHLVPATIAAALTLSGARQALPGEFSRRAVLNGKLDVLQAEAIGDLIDARSHAMQKAALGQLDGGLSNRLTELRMQLLELESLIAYDVDFPEEDDGPIAPARIERATGVILDSLSSLLATAPIGELVREGALVVIAGPPNVGKSSLFNALLGRSRAIVTEIPGTTRDALEAVVDTGKWPIRLVDTAGLRDTDDQLEKLGIQVSERYLSAADLVLACADDTNTLNTLGKAVARHTGGPVIAVRTKADLVAGSDQMEESGALWISARTGAGLSALTGAIDAAIDAHQSIGVDAPMLTTARHRHAIETAYAEAAEFERVWEEEKLPATVAAIHLRTAVVALEELVGSIEIEDVLDRVFSSFCVGK